MLVPALLLWIGCATPSQRPPALESRHFYTVESGFHINAREGVIRYNVLLALTNPREEPLYVNVRYENPADAEAPLTEEVEWPAGEDRFQLLSPPLHGLEPGKRYLVELKVFTDPERTEADDTHQVFILSPLDTRSHGR